MEETAIEKFKKTGRSVVDLVKTIVVDNDSRLKRAINAVTYIKRVRKEIDDFCDPNIDRLNKAHKEALAQKRVFEQPFIEAEQYIKPQISSYMAKLKREIQEAERKQRELKKAEEQFGLAPSELKPIPAAQPKLKGVSISQVWKYRIVNKNIIPSEYWMLNTVMIGKICRESKGQAKIAGVEFYSEDVVKGRSNI